VKHQKSTAERKIQLQVGECEVSTTHHITAHFLLVGFLFDLD